MTHRACVRRPDTHGAIGVAPSRMRRDPTRSPCRVDDDSCGPRGGRRGRRRPDHRRTRRYCLVEQRMRELRPRHRRAGAALQQFVIVERRQIGRPPAQHTTAGELGPERRPLKVEIRQRAKGRGRKHLAPVSCRVNRPVDDDNLEAASREQRRRCGTRDSGTNDTDVAHQSEGSRPASTWVPLPAGVTTPSRITFCTSPA